MIHWKKTNEELPKLDKLVWVKDGDGSVNLGYLTEDKDVLCWSINDGDLTFEFGFIVANDLVLADINPDEWAYVN